MDNIRDAGFPGNAPENGYLNQGVYPRRRVAVPVDDLIQQIVRFIFRPDHGDTPVNVHPLLGGRDIPVRDAGGNREVRRAVRPLRDRNAALLQDGLIQELHVHVVADVDHVAGLFRTEQVSGAADFQVAHRDFDAGTELGKVADGRQPLLRVFSQNFVPPESQIGRRPA